jgi:hypothetical protein
MPAIRFELVAGFMMSYAMLFSLIDLDCSFSDFNLNFI